MLLDTHAWAWIIVGETRLSSAARAAVDEADSVYVSPISFYEISQKVRLNKWPQMAPFVDDLFGLVGEQGGKVAALDQAICLAAGRLDWTHRDPFDRMLAATALHYAMPLISADTVFDGIVPRIW
ncbi:type II toxin-antitoxin system VapC family toxin [Beijerinckia sp. L45]|uniref:type II toxin-antitoxin system VapC family toxin n=1 Tax=Beijerinckia sp. L45 TaxID=1641855 RepID=UPI001FEE615B|nr:type II toxin-antitoxin system VapC family toxin [Beijerinckia sp. L45]